MTSFIGHSEHRRSASTCRQQERYCQCTASYSKHAALDTGELFDWREDLSAETPHPTDASRRGRLRPHVVWFGEMPIGLEQIEAAAQAADLFVAIGTSAVVYPAAGIVQSTGRNCRKVEINLDDTPQSIAFDESIRGKASIEVPKFFATLE